MLRIRTLNFGALIVFLFFCGSALAQIIKWTDEKGNIHFADDISRVPERYRSSIESKSQTSGGVPELKGFRGINWGTDLSRLSDMVPSESDMNSAEINSFVRNGDDLTIGAASLEKIEYGFWKDKFCGVKLLTKGYSNWEGLLEVMLEKFGNGYVKAQNQEEYLWLGEKTTMLMFYDRRTTIGTLLLVSKEMGVEIDRDRKQKIREGVKKGF